MMAVLVLLSIASQACEQKRPAPTGIRAIVSEPPDTPNSTDVLADILSLIRAGDEPGGEALASVRFSGEEAWTVRVEGAHEARRGIGFDTPSGFLAFEDLADYTWIARSVARDSLEDSPEQSRAIAEGLAELGALVRGLKPDPGLESLVLGLSIYDAGLGELRLYYVRLDPQHPLLEPIDQELNRSAEEAAQAFRRLGLP